MVKHDTVRVEVPVPISKKVVRRENVKLQNRQIEPLKKLERITGERETVINDTPVLTQRDSVEIPIERKEYITKDYKAVLEGWHTNLVSMEIYKETKTVTKIKTPAFSITVGPGIGWNGNTIQPYFGVTAGLVLFSR